MATYIELTLSHTKANNINLKERGFDKQNSALRKKEKKNDSIYLFTNHVSTINFIKL